ncbi:hypothetical protein RF11_02505 [Thelohanellus kitauei]|uniref:Uncharacterized protein n=1 Tax=Thelohanellus kitauei TaxID=669202 RepID=A0A0C2M5M9_THEKT|nr:hypothetical protein RF11_02505 [Thelohanellus kitauei]
MFKNVILQNDITHNKDWLINALRVLYFKKIFFDVFTDDMFDNMIRKLLQLAYQEECELVSTLAISILIIDEECIQVASHGSIRIMKHKKILNKYVYFYQK